MLSADNFERIHIKFIDFSVQQSERCDLDYLTIEDVNDRVKQRDQVITIEAILVLS